MLKKLLQFTYSVYENIDEYVTDDSVIATLINNYPQNSNLYLVRAKATLINSLYHTQIRAVYQISQRICKIMDIDNRITAGDSSLVSEIRKGTEIINKNGNQIDNYVFATKYLNWHNNYQFVIKDKLITKILLLFNEREGYRFYDNDLRKDDLKKDYDYLKRIIDNLIIYTHLEDYRYKKIDKALWIFGKYRKSQLPQVNLINIDDFLQQNDYPQNFLRPFH